MEPSANSKPTVRRRRLFEFERSYWANPDASSTGSDVTLLMLPAESSPVHEHELAASAEAAEISDRSACATCGVDSANFEVQRDHFRSDWHKYNAKLKVRGKPTVDEDAFDAMSDIGSIGSLSGSDTDDSEDDGIQDKSSLPPLNDDGLSDSRRLARLQVAEKLEFLDPRSEQCYLVLYKAALPDQSSLSSLAQLGSWAVIMTGGGHFVATLWSNKGVLIQHKTFHRYTSRKKQGGSQAAADEARGGGSRIKSAGATLRRYGEQALQNEVHHLLTTWSAELAAAQCVYIRASARERRDLLVGWPGSPLESVSKDGRCRNIPFPTRRATLKEATRVYDELSTVVMSSASLLEEAAAAARRRAKAQKVIASSSKPHVPTAERPTGPVIKGTAHLKKRSESQATTTSDPQNTVQEVDEVIPELEEDLVRLLRTCVEGKTADMELLFAEKDERKQAVFHKHYFSEYENLSNMEEALGLVGVAAAAGSVKTMEWLLENGVSPTVGGSPYLNTKSKAVRTSMRVFWANHPDKYDYASAGVPSPLTAEDLEAMAEREREKRRRDREKKKEKARAAVEAAKPPEVRAREMRAAAAEARLLGNKCACCKKDLTGQVPFERLAFKYCSTTCVNNHREALK